MSFEGLLGIINCGRSAMGRFGVWVASACSCTENIRLKSGSSVTEQTSTHRSNFDRTTCRLFSLSAVQRATEAMPLLMFLSKSISTSIPIP